MDKSSCTDALTPELVPGRFSEVPGRGAPAMAFWSMRMSATPCSACMAAVSVSRAVWARRASLERALFHILDQLFRGVAYLFLHL